MTLTKEAKALFRAAKDLEQYSKKIREIATELHTHHRKYRVASSDQEKEHHLRKHYTTFSKATRLKDKYKRSFNEVALRLRRVHHEIKRLEI
ncbi:hypothetical protein KY328_03325 [Candidatus Woesearchaeota archaeon]|nr:hypothetical protein [Candidatus Woesearchaeota archaeon]MBW3021925.1 hypothetical protein [Candidatus Woesearchaeota archaeon]